MLQPFGVSTATEARFEVLASIPPPETDEFKRREPINLTLTLGQVQHVRGTLRHALNNAVNAINNALAVSMMTGVPVEVMAEEAGVDFEHVFSQICDIEDVLASAWASAAAESVDFTVPDYAPDTSL